jgi:hypothetical protein
VRTYSAMHEILGRGLDHSCMGMCKLEVPIFIENPPKAEEWSRSFGSIVSSFYLF